MIVRPKYRGPDLPTTLAVAMTAGAATGVEVAHSTKYDLAATSFTLPINIALPDYTPAADQWLYFKYQDASNYWGLRVKTTGVLNFIAVTSGVTRLDIDSTASVSVTNGLNLWGAVSVTRESASVAGAGVFTINGSALGTSVPIAAATPVSLSNTGSLYIAGSNAAGTESTVRAAYPYNRALSAAEVLSLCNNGVAAADVGASQTPVYTQDTSVGVDGWVVSGTPGSLAENIDAVSDGTTSKDNCLRFTKNANIGTSAFFKSAVLTASKNNGIKISVYVPAGQTYIDGFRVYADSNSGTLIYNGSGINGAWVDVSVNVLPVGAALVVYAYDGNSASIAGAASGELLYVHGVETKKIGNTLSLAPTGLAASGLTWTDSSGNGNNGTLPAAGATKVSIRK